ncbi:MAG TPA: SpoIIE family protein phosphatase [Actinoplanes sp.]|jgi:serine phosphatase RsbU (regulator of sigma subunit)
MADEAVQAVVRQILAVVPAGCSWLLPETAEDGSVADFRVAATSGDAHDLYGRGTSRLDERLSELYPSIVGGPLWQIYLDVLRTGEPDDMGEFRYEEKRSGIVAHSLFHVSVHRVLGGLLVWWQRVDEARRRWEITELLGSLGWAEYDMTTGTSQWSPGMYRIFERDPALGPMSRAEQAAALLPGDRGLSEVAWQTMDSGSASDVTVRFRAGPEVKHLRVLSDVVSDSDGTPLKINAVVQDVTARESSRSAIQRLNDRLRTREITALAEHRLAGQLQNLIQPVPEAPFPLPGLEVMAGYLPAESVARVGGDWYHADELPGGRAVLAVGDVAGHGMGAASGMAHLRFALIAWLSIGIDDPSELLSHLNRLCLQLRITGTAVLAVYDPATGELCWARGGHAPPLLARAGATVPLGLPDGLLLGAEQDSIYPVCTSRLTRDDLLLLYTDGLVERRTPGDPPLLTEVTDLVNAASADVDDQTVARLAARLSRPSPDDDTCTLTVRVAG